MKKFAQNPSFLKTLSVYIIFSSFGINRDDCKASHSREEIAESSSNNPISSATMSVPPLAQDILPALRPIPMPKADSKGREFWSELISLDKTDAKRKKRMDEGQAAFIAAAEFITMVSTNCKQVFDEILLKPEETFEFNIIFRGEEYKIKDFKEKMLKAEKHFPALKTYFFSLNQSLVSFRRRVVEDGEREQAREKEFYQQLFASLHQTSEKQEDVKNLLANLTTPRDAESESKDKELQLKVQQLKEERDQLTLQNQQLKLQNQQLLDQIATLQTPQSPLNDEVAVEMPAPKKLSFWEWIKSWFSKSSPTLAEPTERTKLINADEEDNV